MKKLNDKPITPDLFSEEDNEDKNFDKESEQKKEKENEENIINNNNNNYNNNLINNDKIIVEKNEFEQNSLDQTENELPDSNIESEIPNYDVSSILYKYNKYLIENNATVNFNR